MPSERRDVNLGGPIRIDSKGCSRGVGAVEIRLVEEESEEEEEEEGRQFSRMSLWKSVGPRVEQVGTLSDDTAPLHRRHEQASLNLESGRHPRGYFCFPFPLWPSFDTYQLNATCWRKRKEKERGILERLKDCASRRGFHVAGKIIFERN